MSSEKKRILKSGPVLVDLFAGCGGLSLGLEIAGFVPVFVAELNDDARETYLLNRDDRFAFLREAVHHAKDIEPIVPKDPKHLPKGHPVNLLLQELERLRGEDTEVGLVAGGPPCQGYSGIGHRRSYSVPKSNLPSNKLYESMAKVIEAIQPRAFLFENVRGLLHARWSDGGPDHEVWRDVFDRFHAIDGYAIAAQVVFARDYGVPQNRPRVLLVGIRNDVRQMEGQTSYKQSFLRNDAVSRHFLPEDLRRDGQKVNYPDLKDLLDDLSEETFVNGAPTGVYRLEPKGIQRWFRTLPDGELIRAGEEISEHARSKHSDKVLAKFQSMVDNEGASGDDKRYYPTSKFAQRWLPAKWGKKGPTITATSLPDDYVHYHHPRTLTVREWARLQGFPDWYRFAGKRTTGGLRRAGNPRAGNFDRELPKYTQIGNAVPVPLAEAVGRHILKLIGDR